MSHSPATIESECYKQGAMNYACKLLSFTFKFLTGTRSLTSPSTAIYHPAQPLAGCSVPCQHNHIRVGKQTSLVAVRGGSLALNQSTKM